MEQSIRIKTDELQPSTKMKSLREETQEEVNARIEKSIKNIDSKVSFNGEEFLSLHITS